MRGAPAHALVRGPAPGGHGGLLVAVVVAIFGLMRAGAIVAEPLEVHAIGSRRSRR